MLEKIGARCILREIEVVSFTDKDLEKLVHERLAHVIAEEIVNKLPVKQDNDQWQANRVYSIDAILVDRVGIDKITEEIQDELDKEKLAHRVTKLKLVQLQLEYKLERNNHGRQCTGI